MAAWCSQRLTVKGQVDEVLDGDDKTW